MAGGSSPTLDRSHSSSCAIYANSHEEAEQGFSVPLDDFARQPHEAKKTLSMRFSLRSSDSTLLEPSLSGDPRVRQVPRQNLQTQRPWWGRRILHILRQVFVVQSTRRPHSSLPYDWQLGYDQFKYECYEDYPDGWPRVAAFMDSCESFGNYRRFGQVHSRLLINHMSNITDMEKQLFELDKRDESGGPATRWRLKTRYHQEGCDTTKMDLLEKLEKAVTSYDTLLLNHKQLKALDQTPEKDHDSLFKWLWAKKPLDDCEFDWIWRPEDFVSMVPPRRNFFEDFIRSHLDNWPKSWLKRFFKSGKQMRQTGDSRMEFWSISRIAICARLIVVFIAVLTLFIPVILFLLTSMSRGCMAVVVLTFVFMFSVIMSLLTNARMQEIFVGTSTYCAVLVTFLGNLQH